VEARAVKRLLPLALLLGACPPAGLPGDAPDKIRFSHAVHTDAAECETCHNVSDAILPKEATCIECHDREDNCGMCHSRADAPKTYARADRHLNFSHPDHIEYGAEKCADCHRDAAAPILPKHPECSQCHAADINAARCSMCHVDLKRWPLVPVTEMAHRGDFSRVHGAFAAAKGESCAACHEQNFCAACHAADNVPMLPEWRAPEGVDRSFIHRGDFLARHALEAAAAPGLCYRCHDTNTCQSCHSANKIAGREQASPHPPGWGRRGAGVWHGPAARTNIESCAACHDQGAASNCVSCHRVGGVGGNPHPPGWQALGRGSGEAPCLHCHL
jgi:hypothetical protein